MIANEEDNEILLKKKLVFIVDKESLETFVENCNLSLRLFIELYFTGLHEVRRFVSK